MKTIIILFFLSTFSLVSQSNLNIIGKWQCCDSLVSAAYLSTFEFKKDLTFIYQIGGYSDDNPLESISGSYILKNDTLFLNVQHLNYKVSKLRIGNIIDEDSQIFVFEYEEVKKIKYNKKTKLIAIIIKNELNNLGEIKSILINGFDFYKVK